MAGPLPYGARIEGVTFSWYTWSSPSDDNAPGPSSNHRCAADAREAASLAIAASLGHVRADSPEEAVEVVLDSPREAAARQLKEDRSDRALLGLRGEATRFRALGEVALARQVDQRVATELKRASRVSNPMSLALRTEAV